MSGGTGVSSLGSVMPANNLSSSLLKSAHPIDLPHSLGGNTHLYESRGGYYPREILEKKNSHNYTPKSKLHKKKKSISHLHKKTKGGKKHTKSIKNRTRKNFR